MRLVQAEFKDLWLAEHCRLLQRGNLAEQPGDLTSSHSLKYEASSSVLPAAIVCNVTHHSHCAGNVLLAQKIIPSMRGPWYESGIVMLARFRRSDRGALGSPSCPRAELLRHTA